MLDGIFNNVILAYDELELAPRRLALGTYGFPEYPTAIGSTAWTLESAFSLLNGAWDSRGWYALQMITTDAYPYTFGRDYGLGDLVTWVHNNIQYTDYCYEITATDSRTARWQVSAQIGDGSAVESPFAVFQRKIAGLQAAMQVGLLSSN